MLTKKETPKGSASSNNAEKQSTSTLDRKGSNKTRVTIKHNVGFGNQLYIRGKGANLSWEKGVLLKNVKPDEWMWETDTNFTSCEFKILINDKDYEKGENHQIPYGASVAYTPHF